jgi:hypothetical protein
MAATGKLTLFDSIGADGQEAKGHLAESGKAAKSAHINGVHVAVSFQ